MSQRGGIDLGGTKIQAVVVGDDHGVLGESRHETPTTGGPQDVADAMVNAFKEAAQAAGVDPKDLAGIGVGSPGDVDGNAGTVTSARNLPDWEGSFPLAKVLQKALGPPVALGNDVQVATDAEFAIGAAQPYKSVLGVFWGTGVGGGIVLDGKPWVGRSAGGEIGHVVVKIGGRRCPCGRRGCMEAYAGRGAMEARARRLHEKGEHTDLFKIMEQRGRNRLTSGVIERALRRGDRMAHEMMDAAVEALGAGVGSVCNVLDPEAVIIGGGLGLRMGEPYVERIAAAMRPHVFAEAMPEIKLAQLGDLGGAIGAALLAQSVATPAPSKRATRTRRRPAAAASGAPRAGS
jgi:glucokinase